MVCFASQGMRCIACKQAMLLREEGYSVGFVLADLSELGRYLDVGQSINLRPLGCRLLYFVKGLKIVWPQLGIDLELWVALFLKKNTSVNIAVQSTRLLQPLLSTRNFIYERLHTNMQNLSAARVADGLHSAVEIFPSSVFPPRLCGKHMLKIEYP